MSTTNTNALDAGDVVWVDLGSPSGHEQGGRRPALVISLRDYNEMSSLIIVCPISRNPRPWPFKVAIPAIGTLTGNVLVDQLRVIDPITRRARWFCRVPETVLLEVRGHIATLLGIPVSS
jgi:mRNA interferase MazF